MCAILVTIGDEYNEYSSHIKFMIIMAYWLYQCQTNISNITVEEKQLEGNGYIYN